ncbi:ubiquitin carboxyl-terminal hydrolase MINDY-2 [Geospiza fortis]|uniref:Ubiquitin carboxyl-terminal hydrolase n=1 Tax=Geospiza fortis TaxID=48883 RepID=A0A8N5EGR9_GEOFO|nr:ubiquitin carboxyl-terminal hydrolase MINDY-2 [Geospiza fortis]
MLRFTFKKRILKSQGAVEKLPSSKRRGTTPNGSRYSYTSPYTQACFAPAWQSGDPPGSHDHTSGRTRAPLYFLKLKFPPARPSRIRGERSGREGREPGSGHRDREGSPEGRKRSREGKTNKHSRAQREGPEGEEERRTTDPLLGGESPGEGVGRQIKLPPMMEIITAEQLMEYLGDYILDAKPKEISEIQRLNYEQNMSDAMAILHKLQTGLDVNVKFTGVRVFEYTPECIVFDLLDIPLYHGWLVDPQVADIVKAVGNCSYNQLVEKIISCKQSENSELVSEGFVAEQFLNNTATQLTYHGLCELTSAVQEGELCVFFRNNHFSTMTKYKGQLYLLVTDQGFLTEEKVVWESLHNVDGDGNFCDSEFHLRPPSDPETVYRGQQDQIDQDYLMALSLQQEQQNQEINWEQIPEGISDLELAKKLQEEEDRRASQYYQEQEQAAAQVQVNWTR